MPSFCPRTLKSRLRFRTVSFVLFFVPKIGATGEVTKDILAKFRATRHQAMFAPFPVHFKDQIVHIAVFFRQSQHLTRPKSRVVPSNAVFVSVPFPVPCAAT